MGGRAPVTGWSGGCLGVARARDNAGTRTERPAGGDRGPVGAALDTPGRPGRRAAPADLLDSESEGWRLRATDSE